MRQLAVNPAGKRPVTRIGDKRKAEFYPQITQISQIGRGTEVTDGAARLEWVAQ